jgi:hypothetical protein
VAVVVFTLLSAIIPAADPSASKPIAGVIKILVGSVCSCSPGASGANVRTRARLWRPRNGCRPSTL